MKKNKLWLLVAAFAVVVLVLAACGNNDDAEVTGDGNIGIAPPGINVDPDVELEPITLTYLNWNVGTVEDNNLERQLIAAFMERYPHITVIIDDSYVLAEGVGWNENLAILASTGDLPDVFMVSDIGVALQGGWALDITDLAMANPEFTSLPTGMQNTMKFNNRVYSVPLQQLMMGFFANLDLFDALNLDAPTYGFTMDEFETAIREITDLSAPRIGTNALGSMVNWYPGSANENLGFFTFDGQYFHLDAPEMIEAFNLAQEFNQAGLAFYGLSYEQREVLNGGWHGEVFFNGEMGLWFDGSWATYAIAQQGDFDFAFIGIPGGRPIAVLDILSIGSTTEHAEAAYKLANWMGSGTEGFLRRLEIVAEQGITFSGRQPVTADARLLDAFWLQETTPGFREAYDNMHRAMFDWNKIIPGWPDARFYTPTGINIAHYENAHLGAVTWHGVNGGINFADYASRLNEAANEIISNVRNAISN